MIKYLWAAAVLIAMNTQPVLAIEGDKIFFDCQLHSSSITFKAMNNLYTRAFSKMGLEFELRAQPVLRVLSQVEQGIVDGGCAAEKTFVKSLGLNNVEVVNVVIAMGEIQAWSTKTGLELKSWLDLKEGNYTYGCKQGAPISMMYLAENGLGDCIQFSNYASGLKMLNSGRFDVLVGGSVRIMEAKVALGDKDKSQLSGVLNDIVAYPILHVRNQAIKTALEESLRQVLDKYYGPITKKTVALWAELSP